MSTLKSNFFGTFDGSHGHFTQSVYVSSMLSEGTDYSVKVVSNNNQSIHGSSGIFSLFRAGKGVDTIFFQSVLKSSLQIEICRHFFFKYSAHSYLKFVCLF